MGTSLLPCRAESPGSSCGLHWYHGGEREFGHSVARMEVYAPPLAFGHVGGDTVSHGFFLWRLAEQKKKEVFLSC